MSYWTAAQLQPRRERLALHMLAQENFTVYAPKLRERRTIRGRREGSEERASAVGRGTARWSRRKGYHLLSCFAAKTLSLSHGITPSSFGRPSARLSARSNSICEGRCTSINIAAKSC
jgi:hypothetical protein